MIRFFNDNFGTTDVYQSGFPSRWTYVYDKINLLISHRSVDSFFNKILSKAYLMQEQSLSEVEAVEKNSWDCYIGMQYVCMLYDGERRYRYSV